MGWKTTLKRKRNERKRKAWVNNMIKDKDIFPAKYYYKFDPSKCIK